ncbi:MAG: TraR/DksA C4-type zinc finger protein [Verrucomicrobia bacterium]|nr:TraR/DksA C4-type zinc finger protein [Verrucomicrobiota bacterium]
MPKTKPKAAAKPAKTKTPAKAKPAAKPAPKAKVPAKAPAKAAPAKPTKAAPAPAKPAAAAKPVARVTPPPAKPTKPEPAPAAPVGKHPQAFLRQQRERLLALRDTLLDSMQGMAQDNLRTRADSSDASAFGMHQGDAGSDAYDRDFALSMLSQEQDALYEIDEALKRIEGGNYGICEMSGKLIPQARLEAIPFTRYTVECQAQIEKQSKYAKVRPTVTSLFGLTEEEGNDTDDEEAAPAEPRERE